MTAGRRRMSLSGCIFAAGVVGSLAHGGHGGPGSETNGISSIVRDLEGGGKLRNFFQRYFMRGLPDVTVGAAKGSVSEDANGLKEQTFISPPMKVLNGDIINKWLPIDWPEGHIFVKSFSADVIHAMPDGSVPPVTPCCGGPYEADRATSFLHHWTVNKWQVTRKFFLDMVERGGREFSSNLDSNGIYTLLADAGFNDGANGPCWDSELHVFFGIGNEVRGKPLSGKHEAYEFPDPYGLEFDMDAMRRRGEFMTLNTHLIDLRNVTNNRKCTECECAYLNSTGAGPRTVGGLSCCHSTSFNGARCPVTDGVERTNETYYIRYTVRWRDFDEATSKPLQVITFDATDNNTKWGDFPFIPGGFKQQHVALNNDPVSRAVVRDHRSGEYMGFSACHVEYYLPECPATGGSCIHTLKNSWEMPYPAEFVYVRHHFHIGGANATLFSDKGQICVGEPTYGPGGFLLDINACGAWNGGLLGPRIEKGERIYHNVVYNQDQMPHYGVMAMAFAYIHVPKETVAKPGFLI